jgi:hypothetical protein
MFLLRCAVQIPNRDTACAHTDNVKRFACRKGSRIDTGINRASRLFTAFTGLMYCIKGKLCDRLISGRGHDSSVGIAIDFGAIQPIYEFGFDSRQRRDILFFTAPHPRSYTVDPWG